MRFGRRRSSETASSPLKMIQMLSALPLCYKQSAPQMWVAMLTSHPSKTVSACLVVLTGMWPGVEQHLCMQCEQKQVVSICAESDVLLDIAYMQLCMWSVLRFIHLDVHCCSMLAHWPGS